VQKEYYRAFNKWLWNLIYDILGTNCVVCDRYLKDQNKIHRDLHHRIPSEKLFNVVDNWREHSLEEIIEETEKCVLCCGGYIIKEKRGHFE